MEERILKITSPGPQPSLCVLVIDRDFLSSQLLAEALERDRRYEATAIASAELLSGLRLRKANLVVISADLNSRPGRGMELADAVHRDYPDIAIVILLDETSRESVISAFRSGARGVFSRRQSMTEFHDCIQHVHRGGIWAGRTEINYLLEALENIPSPNISSSNSSPQLTRRELQVVQCAAQGKTNKAIAQELGLSEHTVKNYLFRAFEKVGVSSRVELLFYLTIRGHRFTTSDLESPDSELETSSEAFEEES